jgi:hypothetical protein
LSKLFEKTNLQWDIDTIINKINTDLSDKIKLPTLKNNKYTVDQKIQIAQDFLNYINSSSDSPDSTTVVETETKNKKETKKVNSKVSYTLSESKKSKLENVHNFDKLISWNNKKFTKE